MRSEARQAFAGTDKPRLTSGKHEALESVESWEERQDGGVGHPILLLQRSKRFNPRYEYIGKGRDADGSEAWD